MKKNLKLLIFPLIFLFIGSGCNLFIKKERKWRPVRQKKHVFVHVVESKGETYEILAKWYTGKKQNAESIISANPTLNPDRLQIGDTVFVPKKLLRTRKKISRKFIANFYKKKIKKKKKVKHKLPVSESMKTNDDFELIGPR